VTAIRSAEGLDGTKIEVAMVSIGASGQYEIQPIGRAVPAEREIIFSDGPFDDKPLSISAYDRQLVLSETIGDSSDPDGHPGPPREVVDSLEAANLLSSALVGPDGQPTGFHTLAIDVDLPVRVRPSDTPGHYHLFIDAPMPWETYSALLDALVEAGIVEPGYASASKEREATQLRLPWVHKDGDGEPPLDPEERAVIDATDGGFEFHPDSYVVEYVDGKGVLRRRT
jgi:hypothetical protein